MAAGRGAGEVARALGLARVVAHRGASAYAPENTLAAIREAHRLGCVWVEFDVKLSADSVPILMHDAKLSRTTSGRGQVRQHSFAEIRELDAGAWKAARFVGERVPSFAEALDLLVELDMGANVEIKPCPGREVETAWVACEALTAHWPAGRGRMLLSSFALESLRALRDIAPAHPRGLLAESLPRRWRQMMDELDCLTLHLSHRRVSDAALAAVVNEDVPVLCYTVNDASRARRLAELGVTSLISDVPDVVASALQ